MEVRDVTRHDEATLTRVYEALERSGLNSEQAGDAVRELQNSGILFRERLWTD